MLIALVVACTILAAALGVVVWLLLKVANKVWDLEAQVERSLDMIDEAYESMDRIAQIPVMYDDPIVKQVVGNIVKTRDSLLLIANMIGTAFGAEESTEASTQDGSPEG